MRRLHRALWFCLLFVLAVPVFAADRPPCRASRFPESAWTRLTDELVLKARIDVDGDGRPDELVARSSSGSSVGSTSVELSLSKSGRRLEAWEEIDFFTMVAYVPVPDALVKNPDARRVVEEALFPRLCDRPDPSLSWLLEKRHRLRWRSSPPELPESYAVYSNRRGQAVWIYYLGMNHGRGGEPRLLATQGDLVLLGTAHGVILTNPARTRHAWIFVTEQSEAKLRIPSVQGARFEGQRAVVDTLEGPVRIDLRSGMVIP